MLDRLAVTRVVASPDALDDLDPAVGLVVRTAPDEVLVVGDGPDAPTVVVGDDHAIVIEDTGWCGRWLSAAEAERFLAAECAWPRPTARPAMAQGMVAGLAVKLWLETDRTLLVVAHVSAEDLEARLDAVLTGGTDRSEPA